MAMRETAIRRELVTLARELVAIDSPSGREGEVGELVAGRLEGRFDVERQRVAAGRFNVIATRGRADLILNIHLDTVPGRLPVKVEDGYLHGRGAVDAKGPLAALLLAAEAAADAGVEGFAVMLDVGEEVDFIGVRRLVERVPRAGLVVVCEPTGLDLRIGQKGVLDLAITARGKAAHSAFPERGSSAISKLIAGLAAIERLEPRSHPLFGRTSLNIGTIAGGSAINVVADHAEAAVCCRTVPGDEDLLERIRLLLDDPAFSLEVLCDYGPYHCRDEELVQWLSGLLESVGQRPRVVVRPGFTTMYFWSRVAPTVVIGPGDDRTEHTPEERIEVAELVRGFGLYRTLLDRFRHRTPPSP